MPLLARCREGRVRRLGLLVLPLGLGFSRCTQKMEGDLGDMVARLRAREKLVCKEGCPNVVGMACKCCNIDANGTNYAGQS